MWEKISQADTWGVDQDEGGCGKGLKQMRVLFLFKRNSYERAIGSSCGRGSEGSSNCLLVCVGFDVIPDKNSVGYFGTSQVVLKFFSG